jgi:hypothetical protein
MHMPVCKCDDGTPSGFVPAVPFGVWGDSGSGLFSGNGVIGSSQQSSGVFGLTLSDFPNAAGVYGAGVTVGAAGGLTGSNTVPRRKVGLYGTGSNGRRLGGVGVQGESDTSTGVFGTSISGTGVSGDSNDGIGVSGFSQTRAAVLGLSSQGTGVLGVSNDVGVVALGGELAGLFFGDVRITGSLFKGGGGFEIDHPLVPADKYLRHSFVESPDRKNVYDGIATCNRRGEATVTLPKWFDALNADFRYQLTPIGASAPDLFIAEEIKDQRFRIAGGSAGLKVSWQVTGIRCDPWAEANPLHVEERKPRKDKGRYLHPEAHGLSGDRGVAQARHRMIQEEREGRRREE